MAAPSSVHGGHEDHVDHLTDGCCAEPAGAADPPTIGRYIAARLVEVGVRHAFGVPGDFNLLLLDQLLKVRLGLARTP